MEEQKRSKFHGGVIIIAVAIIAIIIVIAQRPEPANEVPEEQFVTFIERAMEPEVRAEFELQIGLLEGSIASLENDETDLTAMLRLGNLYHRIGRLSDAKAMYESIIELNENDVAARENLGVTLEEMGDYRGAEHVWAEALNLSGNRVTVLRLVDLIEKHIPEERPSIRLILEVTMDTLGTDKVLLERLGDWYFAEGEYEKALELYENAKQASGTSDAGLEEKISESRLKFVGEITQ